MTTNIEAAKFRITQAVSVQVVAGSREDAEHAVDCSNQMEATCTAVSSMRKNLSCTSLFKRYNLSFEVPYTLTHS